MAHSPIFRKLIRVLQKAQLENLNAEGKSLPVIKQRPQWTRRRFVKSTILTAGAALTTGLLSRPEKVWSGYAPKIAVIGGGIAGLNAAYQLQKVGLHATVYEARNRLGGRILSVRDATGRGLVNDLGGHFVNSDHEDILALVEEFDLRLFNRPEDAARFATPEGVIKSGRQELRG